MMILTKKESNRDLLSHNPSSTCVSTFVVVIFKTYRQTQIIHSLRPTVYRVHAWRFRCSSSAGRSARAFHAPNQFIYELSLCDGGASPRRYNLTYAHHHRIYVCVCVRKHTACVATHLRRLPPTQRNTHTHVSSAARVSTAEEHASANGPAASNDICASYDIRNKLTSIWARTELSRTGRPGEPARGDKTVLMSSALYHRIVGNANRMRVCQSA